MERGLISEERTGKALVVRCGSEFFLLKTDSIRRIVDPMVIHPVPFAVKNLLGLARFGGEPLSVFSLQGMAGDAGALPLKRMTVVVVDIEGSDAPQRLGLGVDEVLEIASPEGPGEERRSTGIISEPIEINGKQARWFNVRALNTQGSIKGQRKGVTV